MCVRAVIGLVVLLMLSPACPEARVSEETSQTLVKLDEIGRRLNRIEESIQQLHMALRRLGEGKGAIDVRQTPEYQALEKRFEGLQERARSEPLRTLSEIWQAMGDPKELARRLDKLVEAFGATIADPNRRKEFQEDVRALKERTGKEVSEEELYEKVRKGISERLRRASNDREKAWLKRQLDALEEAKGPEREAALARYVRLDNVGALQELARKYSIPREQMVKCGLSFVGRPGRPPRQHEGRERPRPRGAPTRRSPVQPRDRKMPRG